MRTWLLSEVVREAWRSATANVAHSLLLLTATASIAAGVTWAELATTDELLAFQQEFSSRGGWIAVATDTSGRINGADCLALNHLSGVRLAGTVGSTTLVESSNSPGTLFQHATVSVEAIQLWTPSGVRESALANGRAIGETAAKELGVSEGMHLLLSTDSTIRPVGAVFDPTERNPFVARWIVSVMSLTDSATQCWVEFSPGLAEAGLYLLTARFAGLGEHLEVRRWIRPGEFARDPIGDFSSRPQRWMWVPGALAISLLYWVTIWARASEIGLYRAVGTSGSGLLFLCQLEVTYVLVPAALAGYGWSIALHAANAVTQPQLDQLILVGRTVVLMILTTIILAPLAALVVRRQSIADQLKDR